MESLLKNMSTPGRLRTQILFVFPVSLLDTEHTKSEFACLKREWIRVSSKSSTSVFLEVGGSRYFPVNGAGFGKTFQR